MFDSGLMVSPYLTDISIAKDGNFGDWVYRTAAALRTTEGASPTVGVPSSCFHQVIKLGAS